MFEGTERRLRKFLKKRRLAPAGKGRIAKGYSSEIYLVKNPKGGKFALKIEKENSPRREMCEKEVANLLLANKYGIGPKLADYDINARIILMEFIEGKTFSKWLLDGKKAPNKKQLLKVISDLLLQAKIMDEIGLDHGQLAGKGANIIVKHNLRPVIIDFEKASQKRRCHNLNQLNSFLFRNPNSEIARKVKEITSNKELC
ncbi:MAG: hypothetical protein HYW05_00300 [Candidatus Diapherotrites archaeon]|nr:hypothetical protein [Candidatus Diapherotrites archaeon]